MSNNHVHYVNGFLVNPFKNKVVLIEKTKPMWQAGKLNGVGGKIEPGETPEQAMTREFMEETGITVEENFWKKFCTLTATDDNYTVHFFVAHITGTPEITNPTEEVAAWYDTDVVNDYMQYPSKPLIRNVKWLLMMALNPNEHIYEITTKS